MSKKSDERKNEVEATTPVAIAVSIPSAPVAFTFKNEKLNAYSLEISAIRDEMGNVNVKLARVLGRVKTEKCYEDDGFKSVAEYAEATFNIKRSMSYQLAAVGERFYNAETETAKKVAALLTPSNLSEIVKLSDDEISAQLENGAISENSTQSSLREVAAHVKKAGSPENPKVLQQFVVDVTIYGVSTIEHRHFDKIVKEALLPQISTGIPISKTFVKMIDKGDERCKGVEVMLFPDGTMAKIEYEKYFTPVELSRAGHKNGPVKTYTRAELEAMLAALDSKEGEGV